MRHWYYCFLLLFFSFSTNVRAQQQILDPYVELVKSKKKTKKSQKPTETAAKVYDCFTFFNELELLEVRLNELNDVVDYFVLVEMDETFQGTPKPMLFKENQQKFKKFLHKIIYVGVSERIDFHDNPWEREKFQRDQIIRALHHCNKNDVILISDLDEVLSHSAIPRIIDALKDHPIVACQIAFYVYFLNAKERNNGGIRPFAMRYGNLKGKSVDDLRKHYIFNIPHPPADLPHVVYDCGWHFGSMGGLQRFIKARSLVAYPGKYSYYHSRMENSVFYRSKFGEELRDYRN
jgi:beta-1,4-mannosyl-glycoprotein beta-1,4-N-acetylglucosaminyltransferase